MLTRPVPSFAPLQSTQTAAKTEITLQGSTEIVTEFFGYSINRCCSFCELAVRYVRCHTLCVARSILYQRGIYPPETFTRIQKYGLQMLVTTDDGLKSYLTQVLSQLSGD